MTLTPITPNELRNSLNRGAVQFAFKKLDGTLRTAVGTTNLATIPQESHPRGVRQSSPNVVVFFDLEKSAWRSINIFQEIFVVR